MTVCELIGLDPGIYFTDPDRKRQAARDAAATVIRERRIAEAEEAKRRQRH